ncbi:MAG: UDP-N-acetylglucosamine 2-epimerase (non-hydrolyzing) [Rikenellaceae bacterium]
MIKLLTIIGARPQIIKAAALSRAIAEYFSDSITEDILHTGQHYDENMSNVFFTELGIPKPKYNLNVGSGSHGVQTAKMIEGIESVLKSEHYDGMVVYGDTNSTLAGAIAASKIHVPIFHIEAGLRSFNMAMPEEVNRIVCDQLSSILFAPTEVAIDNLINEGFDKSKATFKNGKNREIYNSGDVMYDNSMYFAKIADEKSTVLSENSLTKDKFILATIHRDNNTDIPERLNNIFKSILDIANKNKVSVVLPLHPRTKKLLSSNLIDELYSKVTQSEWIKIIEPVSFLDMICLEKNSTLVMTDSGGVQKEAFFFEKPTIIFRPETEWVEIIENNAGILVDADYNKTKKAYDELANKRVVFPKLFGDGLAAKYIIERIIAYISV